MYSGRNNISHEFNLAEILRFTIFISFFVSNQVLAFGAHISREIKGTIVDERTAEPIEGIIVTATWELETMLWSFPAGILEASEVVTDKQGRYKIPAWGPKFYVESLDRDQPVIRFFKPGYIPLIIRNNTAYHPGLEDDIAHMIKVPLDPGPANTGYRLYEPEDHQVKFGKTKNTFMLVPFEGTDDEYADLLDHGYVSSLQNLTDGRACAWKKVPLTFVTLDILIRRLKLSEHRHIMSISHLGNPERCGSAIDYFREHVNKLEVPKADEGTSEYRVPIDLRKLSSFVGNVENENYYLLKVPSAGPYDLFFSFESRTRLQFTTFDRARFASIGNSCAHNDRPRFECSIKNITANTDQQLELDVTHLKQPNSPWRSLFEVSIKPHQSPKLTQ